MVLSATYGFSSIVYFLFVVKNKLGVMKFIIPSPSLSSSCFTCNDEFHIISQFFIPDNALRYQEIQYCLQKNVKHADTNFIHLLTERFYSDQELGIASDKIKQINIGKRMTFEDVFVYVRKNKIKGYIAFMNSDMYFANDALKRIRTSNMHQQKEICALLRYDSRKTGASIFGPRFDSQDVWIIHSNFTVPQICEKAFGFPFGKPGCDNKIIYLMKILGYRIVNDPKAIQTFHVHNDTSRSYGPSDVLNPPWGVVIPYSFPLPQIQDSLGIRLRDFVTSSNRFQRFLYEDQDILRTYIEEKIRRKKHFIIPRISGVENNVAVYSYAIRHDNKLQKSSMKSYIQRALPVMKNNAGICIRSLQNLHSFEELYLSAFQHCEIYAGWEPHGDYIQHITQSQKYLQKLHYSKKCIWTHCFDIFHYIYSQPWTWALRGKRILIVSPFVETIKEQLPIRKHLYHGFDLFPECDFVFVKPPQTQADENAREFDLEICDLRKDIDNVLQDFDVALLSCGGYANPIASYIFSKDKSVIYVGGVLQMYFGVLGNRWIQQRPDIITLFVNSYWKRPKESETPKNSHKVEDGCYW